MAVDENTPINTPNCSFSERLFSEEVAIAQASTGEPLRPNDWAYEFSTGRKFTSEYEQA